MDDDLDILLTNDDGIHSTGFHALYEGLSSIGSVTAVAPAEDQSAVGRAVSESVPVREHDLGYIIEGKPVDCVVAGLSSLVPETDLVVAGCNHGANIGAAVLGRSGTVSAAVEAAFHGVPGIAASLYIPSPQWEKGPGMPAEWFESAVDATTFFASRAFEEGVFEHTDYLNINAPTKNLCTGELEITTPSHVYELTADQNGDTIDLRNPIWEKLESDEIPDPEGTDRRAIFNNRISVSPLMAPHSTRDHGVFQELATEFTDR